MIELREDQIADMAKLRGYHIKEHRELQPVQAIQELCELSQELTNYLIRTGLKKEVNYLNIYSELFDAYNLMLTTYQMFVKDLNQEEMFQMIADGKIQRELLRWLY